MIESYPRELRQVAGLTEDEVYLLILPLRLLLLRDREERRPDYELALSFMDHESERRKDTSYWYVIQEAFWISDDVFAPYRECLQISFSSALFSQSS